MGTASRSVSAGRCNSKTRRNETTQDEAAVGDGDKKEKPPAESTSKAPGSSTGKKRKKDKGNGPSTTLNGQDDCPVCKGVPPEKREMQTTKAETWLACDECERWFHVSCVRGEQTWALRDLEEWYCEDCIKQSATDPDRDQPLALKLKEPSRKSSRKKAEVNYQKAGVRAGAPNPWYAVAESRPLVTNAFPSMKATDVTLGWLETDSKAFTEPIFIPEPEGLDMSVLRTDITISEIAQAVGPNMPLDVIDVASQSGLSNWTVGKWASYFEDPAREKVRNVISLELSSTPLKDQVVSPKIVRDIDWVDNFWPKDLIEKDIYPQVIRYCLMSPGLSWTDWHIDFSASSVFYHILRGSKVFYFIRPTAENLRKYGKWSGTSQQLGVWLGDECDQVYKVELAPGNTLIIPSGWIHCVYTPSDALVIGGNFLHSYNIATQLRVYQIELATKVPKKFRFPYFVTLLWHVGQYYLQELQVKQHCIPPRILRGLKALSAFLIEQAWRISEGADVSAERRKVANENIPWQNVDEPEKLASDLQKAVYTALDEAVPVIPVDGHPTFDAQDFLDEELPTPTRSATTIKRKNGPLTPLDTTAGKSAKPKASTNGKALSGANGAPEQIVRSNAPPTTSVCTELRERPRPPAIDFGEASPAPESLKVMQDAEVKTTTSENFVKKTTPGLELGSWVVETRRVVTTIERVYFPPMGEMEAKMKMDMDYTVDASELAAKEESATATTNGFSGSVPEVPRDEINRLLGLALPS